MYIIQITRAQFRKVDHSKLIYLKGKSMQKKLKITFLGIIIYKNLHWGEHIKSLANQVAPYCYLIIRLMEMVHNYSEMSCIDATLVDLRVLCYKGVAITD